MEIQLKITDSTGKVESFVIGNELISDKEIEEFAKTMYCEDGNSIKLKNSFSVGAKWARDIIKSRQKINQK